MPALVTHNYFAEDVYKKLDKKSQNKLKKSLDLYYIFCHSFDNFFYYKMPLIVGKNIRDFGHFAQHNNTQSYFINMIKIIKANGLENSSEILAYLYGSITHYVLDSICHPFVFYKTGTYNIKNKDSHKYNGLHAKMEYMIDAYLYEEKTNNKAYKWKFWKEIMPKAKPGSDLVYVLNETYKRTFNKNNMAKYYFKGYWWSRFLYRIGFYDRIGIKSAITKTIDFLTTKKVPNIKYYTYRIKNFNLNYLNIENKTWNHPSNKDLTYNYSFKDLYNLSIDNTIDIINQVNKVLYQNEDIETLLDVIPDIDYATGFIISKNKKMQHFEF